MKVFKTKETKTIAGIELTEQNYVDETNLNKPYVQGDSYFAICPECDNPIQIIGLFGTEKDIDLYAKHVTDFQGKLSKIATYNDIRKQICKYYTGRRCKDPFEIIERDEIDTFFCKTMRDEFDKVVYHWEILTGIKLGKATAKKWLERWIRKRLYFLDFCTSSTLSISLHCAVEPENLIKRWVRVGSDIEQYLSNELSDLVVLKPTSSKNWLQIEKKTKEFIHVDFNILPYYSRKTTNQQCIERMQLQVIAYPDGKEKIKQFNINIDSIHWNAILGMENFRRNQELLDIAQEAFKGIDLDLGE